MEVPEVEDVAEIASTHLDVLYAKITTTKWNSKFIAAKKKKKVVKSHKLSSSMAFFWDQVYNPMKKLNNLLANYVIHY